MALLQPVEGPRGLRGPRCLEVFDPATLERRGEIEVATENDVREAVHRARDAQEAWAALSFESRARHLLAVRALLLDRVDEIAKTICSDTGKPRLEAVGTEIAPAADALTYYAKHARRLLAESKKSMHLMRQKKLLISYRPMGVVGIITPWNFPFILSLNPAVQALMAGNVVVLKPSEVTPFVGLAIAALFEDAGLPEGVFQVVTGDGSTGAALVEGGCDKISFTGSVRVGRVIGEACGRQLIPCTLELGGKDPLIVCDDANVDKAARGAVWGAFSNAGQVCMSVERVYVTRKNAEVFVQKVVELTRELRQGPEAEGEVDVGSLTSAPQLEVIEAQVTDAVAKGARVLTGGRRHPDYPGLFYEPTVLVDVDHGMAIMREETFGPTLPIMVVEDEEEAVRLANDSSYGLQASIWSRDDYKARMLGNGIHAGGITVDDTMVTYGVTESPFGGVRDSGIGRVNGEIGLKSYCHVRTMILPRFRLNGQGLGYPYSRRMMKRFERGLHLLYRSPLGKLLGG